MAKLTDTQKSLAIFGGGIVLAIACGVGIYFDLQTIKELDEKIAAQQTQKANNQKEIDKIPALEKDLVAYKKIVTDNAKILPTDADINAFIRDLATMEKESGISILTLPLYNPITDKADSSITRFPMKMSIKSSTRAFLRFLGQIEGRERLVSVTDFRINPAPDDKGGASREPEHDIQMNFDLYRYDPTRGGAAKTFPIKPEKELQLLESKDVKEIVTTKGRPANLERYQLLPGRDNRRDIFQDPRRRTVAAKGGTDADNVRSQEEVLLEALMVRLEHCRIEYDSYRNAEQARDFLRMAATRRSFLKSKEELEEDLRKISSNNPEFKSRDLQDRYLAEVKRPYEALMKEVDFGGTVDRKNVFTEVMAAGMRRELQDLMDKRMFREAAEKWSGVDAFARDSGKTGIEEGARPHVDAMRQMGEHAQFQVMLADKKIVVQGILRMERGSAAILNSKTLFPGKNFDKDTVFVRVEAGKPGEGDRLIFKIQGHEVDLVPAKPQLLSADKAALLQD